MNLAMTSPSFAHNDSIPKRHTCQGDDLSPALDWSGIPPGTRSLALIIDDPDAPDPAAPKLTWVHWILYNLPPSCNGLTEGISQKELPEETLEGLNDWQRTGYGGPCPPIGRHRYFHKLFALDAILPDLDTPDKARLEQEMHDHILARAELIGTYQQFPG